MVIEYVQFLCDFFAHLALDYDCTSQHNVLVPCVTCSRTFAPQALRKHLPICRKNATKKRRVFNSLKQRVDGTDLAPFHQKSYLNHHHQNTAPPPPLTPTAVQTPPPKPTAPPTTTTTTEITPPPVDMFSPTIRPLKPAVANQRHTTTTNSSHSVIGVATPTVKTTTTKTNSIIRAVNVAAAIAKKCPHCERNFGPKAFDRHVEWCEEHQFRLQARNHPPPTVQLAKERLEARTKYRVPQLGGRIKRTTVREKYATNYGSGTTNNGGKYNNNRQRSSSSLKKATDTPAIRSSGGDVGAMCQQQQQHHIATNNKLPSTVSLTNNPYESAERQFLELLDDDDNDLLNDDDNDYDDDDDNFNNDENSLDISGLLSTPKPTQLLLQSSSQESHHQRWTSFSSSSPATPSDSVKQFTKSVGDLLISEDDDNDNRLPTKRDSVIEPPLNFQDLRNSENYASPLNDIKLKVPKNTKTDKNKNKESEKLKPTKIRSLGKTTATNNNNIVRNEKQKSEFTAEELFNVNDDMYEEYKAFEELYLKEKQRIKSSTSARKPRNNLVGGNFGVPIMHGSATSIEKTCNNDDSAYSRHSLENVGNEGSCNSSDIINGGSTGSALTWSKYCHECGAKYPVNYAKFCVECGIKRLVL